MTIIDIILDAMERRILFKTIEIIEVGLRDGLQREKTPIATSDKITMIHQLVDAGIRALQVTSFVHPKTVPQMADAEAVCLGIEKKEGIIYSGLVLNMKGLERAYDAGLRHVDMSLSASDSHSRKNANQSLREALDGFAAMVKKARELGLSVRAGVQCAFGYYEADVTQEIVLDIVKSQLDLGIDSLALADSTGMANPRQIKTMLHAIKPLIGETPLILHLHDTRGMGLANVVAAIETGCTRFDTAFGGMGGCNFIPEALGNIATEDTVNMLHDMGYETGIDIAKVAQVSRTLQTIIGQELPGKMYQLLGQ
ncbi:MAG: hydroxymethylglutaryl-CoA lyase [Anaerolineae bacterium]|nr:hydroxymethylglutaryl-CoA lyase [Anaerolineae bacterium]